MDIRTLAAMAEQAYEDDNRLWPAVDYPFLIRNATTDTVAWCCKFGTTRCCDVWLSACWR